MLYILINEDRSDGEAGRIRDATRKAHLAYLERHKEPFRRAGLFQAVKITRMRRGQWNPQAAPKTAEGN